jgi:hypothetical protein
MFSRIVFYDPYSIPVHPVNKELFACCSNVTGVVKKRVGCLYECFGLTIVGISRNDSMFRRRCCAIAVPFAPIETPITPAGLPAALAQYYKHNSRNLRVPIFTAFNSRNCSSECI